LSDFDGLWQTHFTSLFNSVSLQEVTNSVQL
jgi:hypothetical protein